MDAKATDNPDLPAPSNPVPQRQQRQRKNSSVIPQCYSRAAASSRKERLNMRCWQGSREQSYSSKASKLGQWLQPVPPVIVDQIIQQQTRLSISITDPKLPPLQFESPPALSPAELPTPMTVIKSCKSKPSQFKLKREGSTFQNRFLKNLNQLRRKRDSSLKKALIRIEDGSRKLQRRMHSLSIKNWPPFHQS